MWASIRPVMWAIIVFRPSSQKSSRSCKKQNPRHTPLNGQLTLTRLVSLLLLIAPGQSAQNVGVYPSCYVGDNRFPSVQPKIIQILQKAESQTHAFEWSVDPDPPGFSFAPHCPGSVRAKCGRLSVLLCGR